MQTIVKALGVVLAIGLVSGPLASCSSSGGGGGATSPPPPTTIGTSTSGGTINSDGDYEGAFRGPAGGANVLGESASLFITRKTTPGSPGDVVVDVAPSSGAPTVTITLSGSSWDFDLGDAASASFPGYGAIEGVLREDPDADRLLTRARFDFEGRAPRYSTLGAYTEIVSEEELFSVFATFGADAVSMPAKGTASFDTGVFGTFFHGEDPHGLFLGRGAVSVDFGAGTVTGAIPDVDFIDDNDNLVDASPGGITFGLSIDAAVEGDDFRGAITATGIEMAGGVEGDFYGPTDAAPEEIGGAFAMEGPDGVAFGGLQGVVDGEP